MSDALQAAVEDWAQREAEQVAGYDSPEREPFAQGIVHAFSALLSDSLNMLSFQYLEVTKGDTE